MGNYKLRKNKWKPGDIVVRFGDWRKGEFTAIIDIPRWHRLGNPEEVIVLTKVYEDSNLDESKQELYALLVKAEAIAVEVGYDHLAKEINNLRYSVANTYD